MDFEPCQTLRETSEKPGSTPAPVSQYTIRHSPNEDRAYGHPFKTGISLGTRLDRWLVDLLLLLLNSERPRIRAQRDGHGDLGQRWRVGRADHRDCHGRGVNRAVAAQALVVLPLSRPRHFLVSKYLW